MLLPSSEGLLDGDGRAQLPHGLHLLPVQEAAGELLEDEGGGTDREETPER